MKKIIFILVLLACIVPAASAAGFVWNPTTATDYHTYQGERISGYLDNTLSEAVSVVQYEWFDGSQTQYLTFARGYEFNGVREQGAAMYSSLPADGNWWMTTSPTGSGFWGSSSISEVYFATSSVGRDESFYAGYPNQDNDYKTNTLTIRLYDRSTYPQLIQTITKTYFIHRLYPFSHVDVWSENPYTAGSDIASQILQFNTSISPYTVYTIDHYMLTNEGNPIMGTRFFRKWDSASNQWLDTYWRQYLTNNEWGEWSGDYTWDEAYLGTFSVPLEEGNYTLRTTFYDYKGRSHYNCVFDTPVNVISTLDKYYINFKDKATGSLVTNNVYVTLRNSDDVVLYSGYLQGEKLEIGYTPPKTVKISASAPGYTPEYNSVTHTFTEDGEVFTYYFESLSTTPSSNFDVGTIKFLVTEGGTNQPLPNTKIVMEGMEYFTDNQGIFSVSMPANGLGRVTPDIEFGIGDSVDFGIMGDWNGDGVDTFGIVRYSGIIGWYMAAYNEDGTEYTMYTFGSVDSSDTHPFTGDWNGDGKTNVGVYRAGVPEFILSTNTGGVYSRFNYDLSTYYGSNVADITILSGDWNGDGIDTIATFYNGVWRQWSTNSAARSINQFTFGMAGDKPLVGDWNGDGIDTVGVRRNNLFILGDANSASANTFRFYYGSSGSQFYPLAGDFNNDGKDKIALWNDQLARFTFLTGGYNYEIRYTGKPSVFGTVNVFEGKTTTVSIVMQKDTTYIPPSPSDRPEGEGVGLLQVLLYLMSEEGIEDEEEQNIVLGMLIIAFAVVMVGGLVAGGYGVLVGGIFGFILSVIVGFIPIWIPLSFIALGGIYILMKVIGGDS